METAHLTGKENTKSKTFIKLQFKFSNSFLFFFGQTLVLLLGHLKVVMPLFLYFETSNCQKYNIYRLACCTYYIFTFSQRICTVTRHYYLQGSASFVFTNLLFRLNVFTQTKSKLVFITSKPKSNTYSWLFLRFIS